MESGTQVSSIHRTCAGNFSVSGFLGHPERLPSAHHGADEASGSGSGHFDPTRQPLRGFSSEWSGSRYQNQSLPRDVEKIKKILATLRPNLDEQNYSYLLLQPKNSKEFDFLKGELPTSEFEAEIVEKLVEEIQTKWYKDETKEGSSVAKLESDGKTLPTDPNMIEPNLFAMGVPNQAHIYAEAGPIDNHYYYYHPIYFKRLCLDCHADLSHGASSDNQKPIRIVRVKLPHTSTRTWAMWSYSILIAVAIGTLGSTLFLFHWILKRLVLRPLGHLHEVSDEISRGQTDRRAIIETDDEFKELGEAFNRMLRHLTETEMEVRKVNSELDRRVDQLAQVNLQLYEANRLKSEFLANMSHELRTPLNSILGFSEVLQGFESLSDKQKRYAGNIQRSGRLLLDMINDILDLAKMEAGKMQVRPTYFDLIQLVYGQCDVVRSLSEEKNIDLQVDPQVETLSVYTDQPKIQQILTNLLSNAIKFTPEGGLIIVQAGVAEEERFFVSVSDTGVGIAESDFEIIFEKFRQGRITAGGDELAREYSGTGLGLSIVRELCKLLGGEVMLSSTLGQGSIFQIELPVHYEAEIPSPEEAIANSNANMPRLNREREST